MATVILKKKYYCSDRTGCPGHEAELEFQSAASIYSFEKIRKIRGDETYLFEPAQLQVFIDLLWELSKIRADIIRLVPPKG